MKHLPMLSALLRYEIHDSHGILIALKQSKVTVFWAAILFYFCQSTCFDPEISSQNNFWTQSGSDEKLNSSGFQTLLRSLSRLELKCHPWWRWSATDSLADCIYDRLTRYWIVQTLRDLFDVSFMIRFWFAVYQGEGHRLAVCAWFMFLAGADVENGWLILI